MKNGMSYSHPGAGNPDIIDYAGPIDPQVGTVGVWDLKGNLLGTVVNFACHATTSPGGISASWIGSMERTIRGATGNASLPVVFMQGACGVVLSGFTCKRVGLGLNFLRLQSIRV